MQKKRCQSLVSQPQKNAIQVLLDCSNNMRYHLKQQIYDMDELNLCPWINVSNKKREQNNKSLYYFKTCKSFNRTVKKAVILNQKATKSNFTTISPTLRYNKYDIQNQPLTTKNINLSKQFQILHNRKKSSYVRGQIYLRLKTQ